MSSSDDERDRPKGEAGKIEFVGARYILALDALLWQKKQWAGSEYTEHLETVYYFEGEGYVEARDVIAAPARFLFTLSSNGKHWYSHREQQWKNGPNLEWDVLKSKDWGLRHCPPDEYLIPERRAGYIDALCEQILKEYRVQVDKQIPRICLARFEHEQLVRLGFAYDRAGQANLALETA